MKDGVWHCEHINIEVLWCCLLLFDLLGERVEGLLPWILSPAVTKLSSTSFLMGRAPLLNWAVACSVPDWAKILRATPAAPDWPLLSNDLVWRAPGRNEISYTNWHTHWTQRLLYQVHYVERSILVIFFCTWGPKSFKDSLLILLLVAVSVYSMGSDLISDLKPSNIKGE